MSLANGESSFHHKGKEVSTEDPPVEAIGGEASHFKSDHSKEEKRGHDLSNGCPPLIDPWYDTHIHFSVVSGDYFASSAGPCVAFPLSLWFQSFFGLPWLSPFPTSTSAKEPYYPCPFSLSSNQVHHWVGRSGWTWSCLMWVLWWLSRLACWRL